MFTFRLSFRYDTLKRRFERAKREFADLRPEMQRVGEWVLEDGRKRLKARNSRVSIGRLDKSLQAKAYQRAVTISSHLPYARIQQEGGTVRAKNGKYLAIPLQEKHARSHTWPRMWKRESLRLVRARDGRLFLEDVRTPGGGLVYRLIAQVTIPGRPYLVKSAELVRYMRTIIAEKLKKLAG